MNVSLLLAPIAQIYELGGFVTLILLALSIVAVAVIILKFWQFSTSGVGRRRSAGRAVDAWIHGENARAIEFAEAGRGPVAETIAAALRGVSSETLPRQTIEEDVGRIAQEKLHDLSSGLRLLEAIAQIAPLLGLFGTVLGMIQAFQAMQSAGSNIDPSQLAGGIWVALLTTAVGLAVAMPTQLVTSWFDGRIENERVAMETALTAVFTRRATERPLAPSAAKGSRPSASDKRVAGAALAPGE